MAVAVIVEETGAAAPSTAFDAGLRRHISECSVPVVVVKRVRAVTRDIEVEKAVVVVIAHRHARAETAVARYARRLSHINKSSFAGIAQQGIARRRLARAQP